MIYVDQTFDAPADNLAADLVLLDQCEDEGREFLRIWKPPTEFVVIGRGNNPESEVNLPACDEAGIPVLRRESGGGAVLLGPGCLCYSVGLGIHSHPALETAESANHWIMRRFAAAIGRAAGQSVNVAGDSDLAIEGKKIAGHAQRRRRRSVLLHGSLMLDVNVGRMATILKSPSREPSYRGGRDHRGFVANLDCPADVVAAELRTEWSVGQSVQLTPAAVRRCSRELYNSPKWSIRPEP